MKECSQASSTLLYHRAIDNRAAFLIVFLAKIIRREWHSPYAVFMSWYSKETASTFHTVRKYVRLFLSSGKSIEQFLSLPAGLLDELFGCTESRHREPSSRRIELDALLPGYVSRLSRKGMSFRNLFKEYYAEYPDGFRLSSFKQAVRQYKFHIKVVGHVEHYAADQMYIDFAGDRLEVVDEMTGETKKAEVFVAILPFLTWSVTRQ